MKFIINSLKNKYSNVNSTQNWFNTYKYSLFFLTVFVAIAVMGGRRLGGLQALELIAYDWMVNLHKEDKIDPKLLIVEITDPDIEQQQTFPIVDKTIAKALKNIQQHQPKVIGFDLYREVALSARNRYSQTRITKRQCSCHSANWDGGHNVPAPPGVDQNKLALTTLCWIEMTYCVVI